MAFRRNMIRGLIIIFIGVFSTPTNGLTGLKDGLVGYWSFDEGSGDTAHDYSGNGNNAKINGAVWTTGVSGHALSFDGLDDYVNIGNDESIKPNLPITISCWIVALNYTDYGNIFLNDKMHWPEAYYGVSLCFNTSNPTKTIAITYGDGGAGPSHRRTKTGTTQLSLGVWYHVVGVIRGATDMDIYINGRNDGGTYFGSGGSIKYSDSPGYIGQCGYGYSGYFFPGYIDEVRIYNRALSAAEIESLYDYPSYVTDETENRERPSKFALSQNYPNPFNQSTKIEFTLAKSGFISLNIYDLIGRKIRTLVSENLPSGYKSVFWDGKNDEEKEVASGIYLYRLRAGELVEFKKMVLLK